MKNVFTKKWFAASGIRALKTVAQTAIAGLSEVNEVTEIGKKAE